MIKGLIFPVILLSGVAADSPAIISLPATFINSNSCSASCQSGGIFCVKTTVLPRFRYIRTVINILEAKETGL